MAYQQVVFGNGETYHCFNRGVEKRLVFLDQSDYNRFRKILDYYRFKNQPIRYSLRNRPTIRKKPTKLKPLVEIISYCLMPNHFHILVKQLEEDEISIFISKVTNSYTKYFNTRYKRVGSLFQGPFKAVRIEDEKQLLHVSRYIHLNPLMGYLVKDLKDYIFSSYRQFLGLEDGFCYYNQIIESFPSTSDYEKFVLNQESYAREIKIIEHLILEESVHPSGVQLK